MAQTHNIRKPSLTRRIFGSVWLRMLVFIAVFVLLATLFTGGTGTKVQEKQLDFLENAVTRSAVQCYALEGRFPDNLSYLEENYGLIIDHQSFAVYYEPLGGNLLPQIRVIPLNH